MERDNRWRSVDFGDHRTQRRRHRNDRHRPHNRHRIHHYIAQCLLAVTLASPALAEGDTNNVARPQAAATSNNTNQSVQINQSSAVSRQSFGSGVNCSVPSFNATTFALGNETLPYDPEGYVRSGNYGVQLGFSVPLDGSITEMCKDLVRRQLERERLSYELSRAVKCSELLDKGYTIRPDSDLHVLCGHIVSISAWRRTQQEASPVILQDSSVPSSSKASRPSADTEESDQQQESQPQPPQKRLQQ